MLYSNLMSGKTKSGFSLIELMVIVSVLAILVAVSVPIYRDYRTKAQISSAVVIMQDMINKGLEQYNLGDIDNYFEYNGTRYYKSTSDQKTFNGAVFVETDPITITNHPVVDAVAFQWWGAKTDNPVTERYGVFALVNSDVYDTGNINGAILYMHMIKVGDVINIYCGTIPESGSSIQGFDAYVPRDLLPRGCNCYNMLSSDPTPVCP